MNFKKLIIILNIALLSGCGETEEKIYHEEAYVFGTLVKFTINDIAEDTARRAVKAAGEEFQYMHENWHAWKPGELTRLNTAISLGNRAEVSDFLLPLLKQSKQFYAQSNGLFNPAIGGLIETWGFHNDELPVGSLPSFDEVKTLVRLSPSMNDVQIDGHMITSKNTSVQFDFGGFGKGAALDRAEIILKEHGIKNAVINAGGDLNTMGNPAGQPWKVGIRHPVHWGVIASVELSNGEDLYTSGNYERFRMHDGIKYAHIIDPRNGMPVQHIVSTSIIDKNGALADAAATALTVAGPEDWHKIAKKMGVRFAMLVDVEGTVYLNPAMLQRVTFEPNEPKRLIISDPLS